MANETIIGYLPFFHIYGFMYLYFLLKVGGTTVTMPRFIPDKFLEYLQKYKVKVLNLVPPIAQFLAKHPLVDNYDLSSCRLAFSGAAPLKEDAEKELLNRHKNIMFVGQGYGMTETGMATHLPGFDAGKAGNGGRLGVNVEIKVIDPETGRELGVDEDGEVLLRGPSMMKGYLNRPQATADTIDEDGWVHTGDIGHYDSDNYIFIVDRIKELIKVKGLQVAPAELESYLMTHPDVQDAAVIGVPDVISGEVPRAFVVVKEGRKLTQDQLKQYIAERVSPYKQLAGGVVFVNEVPKSPSGKILRRILRDSVANKDKAKL